MSDTIDFDAVTGTGLMRSRARGSSARDDSHGACVAQRFDRHPFADISIFRGTDIGCAVVQEPLAILEAPGFLALMNETGECLEMIQSLPVATTYRPQLRLFK